MPDFFDGSGEGGVELPRCVYATLAESEPDREGGAVRHFECVDAQAFDHAPEGQLHKYYWERAPVSVIEYAAARHDMSLLAQAAEGDVVEIDFDGPDLEARVQHYFNLFTQPALRQAKARKADGAAQRIKIAPPKDAFPSAARNELIRILAQGDHHTGDVAVYDVGQGNCNALLRHNYPALYFDMGGGVLNNARSYPTQLTRLCPTGDPPVVLSHWDWDHWSTAMRSAGPKLPDFAVAGPWIVPRQKIGPVHASFLSRLMRQTTVHFWDEATQASPRQTVSKSRSVAVAPGTIGLAMRIKTSWSKANGVLLPGDCSYKHLPWDEDDEVDALVISHHGGHADGGDAPPPAQAHTRWVLSCGQPNAYDHPRKEALKAHRQTGWKDTNRRSTEDRTGFFGHTLITDPNKAPTFPIQPGCGGGSCQLTLTQ